jgi:hypothetical protein
MMTDDLIAFLRAQLDARERELDEDERVALASAPPCGEHWAVTDEGALYVTGGPGSGYIATGPFGGGIDDGDAKHISRWDPARVLARIATERAEVNTKRRLVDELIRYMEGDYAPWNADYLRLLALPYADRDGYEEGWRL